MKFLQGGRSLDSVLSRHTALEQAFDALYGEQFKRVRDWYAAYGGTINVVEVSLWLSELAEDLIEDPVAAKDI